ncbi:hypothetical protein KEM54_004761 [Ascosphaera aggregata]|nr:hypothetical protein KEM54_004761 [Ascosphaera aggregata]
MALFHADPFAKKSSFTSLYDQPNPFVQVPFIRRKLEMTTIAERRRAAAKEASHYVFKVVKSGWSYDSIRGSEGKGCNHEPSATIPLSREQLDRVVGWRDRGCDTDSDIEDVNEEAVKKKQKKFRSKSHDERARRQSQLEANLAAARQARYVVIAERRKRRRQIELDEMAWNEGLRLWINQRDAWTGAKLRGRASCLQKDEREPEDTDSEASSLITPVDTLNMTIGCEAKAAHSQQQTREMPSSSSTSIPVDRSTHTAERVTNNQVTKPPLPQQSDEPAAVCVTYTSNTDAVGYTVNADEPIIPIMRPYLPRSNPLVASIKPSTYQSIYTKVVKQGMTPAVPINLSDMTKALVEGWKQDGEWPPPATAPVANTRNTEKGNPKSKNGTGSAESSTPPKATRRLSATLSGAMRKAWNFSMHPSYHFHLRSGTSGTAHPSSEQSKGSGAVQVQPEKKDVKIDADANQSNERRHSIAEPVVHASLNDDMHLLHPVHSVVSDPGSSVPGSIPVLSPVSSQPPALG